MKRTVCYAVVLLSVMALAGCGGTGQRRVNPVPYEPSGKYIASEVASIKFEITASPEKGFYYGAGCAGSACNLLAQAAPRKAAMEEPERAPQCALPAPSPASETKPEPPADREAGSAPAGNTGGNVGVVKEAGAASEGEYKYPEVKEGEGRTLKVYKRE